MYAYVIFTSLIYLIIVKGNLYAVKSKIAAIKWEVQSLLKNWEDYLWKAFSKTLYSVINTLRKDLKKDGIIFQM